MPTKQFPGRYESLAPISEFVAQFATEAGFDSQGVYAVRLAVDEACTNIIEHGYGGEDRGDIQCTCDVLKDGVKITLQDWGRTFDPDAVPDPNFDVPLEKLEPRGAGLFMIRKIMDELHFELGTHDGNILVMVKNR
jgi:serine/threonine-protein kinase RsbW